MNRFKALIVAASIAATATVAWRLADWNGEPAEQAASVDPSRATVERILERTARESRTGVVETAVLAAPESSAAVDSPQRQSEAERSGVDIDSLPEGYSFGTYRGPMRRAPLRVEAGAERPPNPVWLDPATAPESILGQARETGREFTFAVVRLLPRTNRQDFGQALAALGAQVEGRRGCRHRRSWR
ncbi:MAG: hypothetical protein OXC70_03425 [Gammaproteobacteria bacterium]|nr:hypothetical protein [Gammaproteobacteria bacterium]